MKIEDKFPTFDDDFIDGKYEDDLNILVSEVNKELYEFINKDINVLKMRYLFKNTSKSLIIQKKN